VILCDNRYNNIANELFNIPIKRLTKPSINNFFKKKINTKNSESNVNDLDFV